MVSRYCSVSRVPVLYLGVYSRGLDDSRDSSVTVSWRIGFVGGVPFLN